MTNLRSLCLVLVGSFELSVSEFSLNITHDVFCMPQVGIYAIQDKW